MKGKLMLGLLAAMLLSGTFAAAANDAEPGSISYRRVYELLYQFRALPVEQTNRLQFLGRVINPNGNTPEQLLIQDERTQPVIVDAFGLFDIPMSPQLAQLNPRMVGEPPATILKMGLAIVIRLPAEGMPDLALLKEGVQQTNSVMLARARVAPERVPQATGVTMRFSPSEKTSVAVLRDGEWQSLEADQEGRVDLQLDESVTDLRVPRTPLIMFPLFP